MHEHCHESQMTIEADNRNRDSVSIMKAKEEIAKYNQEVESLKKKSTMQKIVIALQVLMLGVVVGRRHF